jgi:hypothetical protein
LTILQIHYCGEQFSCHDLKNNFYYWLCQVDVRKCKLLWDDKSTLSTLNPNAPQEKDKSTYPNHSWISKFSFIMFFHTSLFKNKWDLLKLLVIQKLPKGVFHHVSTTKAKVNWLSAI